MEVEEEQKVTAIVVCVVEVVVVTILVVVVVVVVVGRASVGGRLATSEVWKWVGFESLTVQSLRLRRGSRTI